MPGHEVQDTHATIVFPLSLQHTATHCNTLQHPATPCNTLQHTTAHCNTQTRQMSFRCSFFRCSFFPGVFPSFLLFFLPSFLRLFLCFQILFLFSLFSFLLYFDFFFNSLILFLILSFFLPVMVCRKTQYLFCSLLLCVSKLVTKFRTKTRQFFF